jgi:hypothetical protein
MAHSWHEDIQRTRRKKQRYRLLSFTLRDIAEARGITVVGVSAAIKRGLLDPTDLKSIAEYILRVERKTPATPKNAVEAKAFAFTKEGNVQTWGRNDYGQL